MRIGIPILTQMSSIWSNNRMDLFLMEYSMEREEAHMDTALLASSVSPS